MKRIAFYMNGHGYGHAVRSLDLVNGLLALEADWQFDLVSSLPADFVLGQVNDAGRVRYHQRPIDGGLIQKDSLRADLPASAQRLQEGLAAWGSRVDAERKWLQTSNIALVLNDIAGVPLDAAADLGISSLSLGNFGWDFIYGNIPDSDPVWAQAAERYAEAYARGANLAKYPWAPAMQAFTNQTNCGLVVSKADRNPGRLARDLGVDPGTKLGLMAFTSLNDPPVIGGMDGVEVFTVARFDQRESGYLCLPVDWSFRDALASADFVIGKPGFGLFSDCAVNEVPLICVERNAFAEADLLMAGLGHSIRGLRCQLDEIGTPGLSDLVANALASPEVESPVDLNGVVRVHELVKNGGSE